MVLEFGYELAKTAHEIQKAVADQVSKMTNKRVAKVDVIIEAVRNQEAVKFNDDDNLGLPASGND